MNRFLTKPFIIFLILFQWGYGLTSQTVSLGWFTKAHIVTINPKEHPIAPALAKGDKMRRESVLTLAKRHGALAAVNGGFWKSNGSPAGALKINGRWYGEPVIPRAVIGWREEGKIVFIDRMQNKKGWGLCDHIVGGAPLLVKNGMAVNDFQPERIKSFFLNWWHPRTAVGIRPNGDWVFVVIDGRTWGMLGGMTIRELAQFMVQLGCVEALNLDGGSSSTLVIQDRVVNTPCGSTYEAGKWVDAVSDAILIYP